MVIPPPWGWNHMEQELRNVFTVPREMVQDKTEGHLVFFVGEGGEEEQLQHTPS